MHRLLAVVRAVAQAALAAVGVGAVVAAVGDQRTAVPRVLAGRGCRDDIAAVVAVGVAVLAVYSVICLGAHQRQARPSLGCSLLLLLLLLGE